MQSPPTSLFPPSPASRKLIASGGRPLSTVQGPPSPNSKDQCYPSKWVAISFLAFVAFLGLSAIFFSTASLLAQKGLIDSRWQLLSNLNFYQFGIPLGTFVASIALTLLIQTAMKREFSIPPQSP